MTDPLQRVWTAAEIFALGVKTNVPTAGEVLVGWGPSESYKAVARGEFPVPVIKVGRRMIVPVAAIVQLLGLASETDEADSATNPVKEPVWPMPRADSPTKEATPGQ